MIRDWTALPRPLAALAAFAMPWLAARQIRLLSDGLELALDGMVKHMEREHPDRHLHSVK